MDRKKPKLVKAPAAAQQLKPKPTDPAMEVHHHGHVHESKKWKEYLFQFFMLFLAVFCGFLAEYKLEQLIERHREHEYATSMINDLKTDTAHMSKLLTNYKRILGMHDSLMTGFDRIKNGYNADFDRQSQSIHGFPDFIYTDGTIQQLKNSGGFRLMRNRQVVDSILAYDADVKKMLINERVMGEELSQLSDIENEVYDYQKLDAARRSGLKPQDMEAMKMDVVDSNDPKTLARFYRQIRYYSILCSVVHNQLVQLKGRATRLLQFIQEEYD